MPYAMVYIGAGAAAGDWRPGVPAEDHTVTTKAEATALEASGLYRTKRARRQEPAASSPSAPADPAPEE